MTQARNLRVILKSRLSLSLSPHLWSLFTVVRSESDQHFSSQWLSPSSSHYHFSLGLLQQPPFRSPCSHCCPLLSLVSTDIADIQIRSCCSCFNPVDVSHCKLITFKLLFHGLRGPVSSPAVLFTPSYAALTLAWNNLAPLASFQLLNTSSYLPHQGLPTWYFFLPGNLSILHVTDLSSFRSSLKYHLLTEIFPENSALVIPVTTTCLLPSWDSSWSVIVYSFMWLFDRKPRNSIDYVSFVQQRISTAYYGTQLIIGA